MSRMKGNKMKSMNVLYGLLIVIGGLCFAWFCWPLVFKGILNAGNGCGMLGAAVLIFYGARHRAVHQFLVHLKQDRAARVCLAALAVLVLAGAVLAAAAAYSIIRARSEDIPDNTPAVLLGCSVMGTRPSRILQERIDAAYAYLRDHPGAVCVLSGGQGKDEDISEAECMYRELVKAGIDGGRLYKEPESVNTQENLANSKKILDRLGLSGAVTIISSDFHLYRGRYWGNALGFQTYGFAQQTDWRYLPTFFLREVIAVVHLWLTNIM